MNLTRYTAASQYVKAVVDELSDRLTLPIESAYIREFVALDCVQLCYHTGEVDPKGVANDGRKQHEIEIRFLVYVPLSVDEFELEALDLACRIERELMQETFANGELHETLRVVSNMPRKFDPENGFFLRVVTVKQLIRMGGVADEYTELAGSMPNDFINARAD